MLMEFVTVWITVAECTVMAIFGSQMFSTRIRPIVIKMASVMHVMDALMGLGLQTLMGMVFVIGRTTARL
jgi:hypothetical protein